MGLGDGPGAARDLLVEARVRLARAGDDTARLDAEVLLMSVLDLDRAGLYLVYDRAVAPVRAAWFRALVERRAAGAPVAYLTGHREFMGLDFLIDSRVLVPRPETEYLVEWALGRARGRSGSPLCIVDVGTGSGAIAVGLALRLPSTSPALLVGSDVSLDALRLARINAARLAPGRVDLVAGDLLDWCRPRVDLVVANLPYLRDEQAHAGLAWEPHGALYSSGAGFDLYRRLLPQAAARLTLAGALACEIDPDQRDAALALARAVFPRAAVAVRPDFAGLDRYLIVDLAPDSVS